MPVLPGHAWCRLPSSSGTACRVVGLPSRPQALNDSGATPGDGGAKAARSRAAFSSRWSTSPHSSQRETHGESGSDNLTAPHREHRCCSRTAAPRPAPIRAWADGGLRTASAFLVVSHPSFMRVFPDQRMYKPTSAAMMVAQMAKSPSQVERLSRRIAANSLSRRRTSTRRPSMSCLRSWRTSLIS